MDNVHLGIPICSSTSVKCIIKVGSAETDFNFPAANDLVAREAILFG